MAIAFSFHLGNKLRKVENRLLNILNKDVKSRLLQLLLQLAADNKSIIDNKAVIEKFLTHDDIAKLIGSSRQTVIPNIISLQANLCRLKLCAMAWCEGIW